MTKMHVAALQQSFTDDLDTNIDCVEALVREAASRGAKVILPSELFEGHYFCKVQDEGFFARAQPVESHKAVSAMRKLAKELGVYIPTSFFERDGQHYYNSLAMIDDAVAFYTEGDIGTTLATPSLFWVKSDEWSLSDLF